jgi:hypothetical protein
MRRKLIRAVRSMVGAPPPPPRMHDITRFAFAGDVAADLRDTYGYSGDLAAIFAGNTGPIVHKWHHYIPLYDRYLAPWRGRPVRFLEIGVSKGGSMTLWRKFLGPEAVIFGIDIDPDCAAFDGIAGQVRIGSQDDPAFLTRVVDEMGGVDVVLDDGSHVMKHVHASIDILWPRLETGGLYLIEDLHTAYWPAYGGGLRARENLFNRLRLMVDDLHGPYHGAAPADAAITGSLTGLHIHDSIVVLEKGARARPRTSQVGTPT